MDKLSDPIGFIPTKMLFVCFSACQSQFYPLFLSNTRVTFFGGYFVTEKSLCKITIKKSLIIGCTVKWHRKMFKTRDW